MMSNAYSWLLVCVLFALLASVRADVVFEPGPPTIPCFDVYEAAIQVDPPPDGNPFTDVKVEAVFTAQDGLPVHVEGFCDDQKGGVFRVRFSPSRPGTKYTFSLTTNLAPERQYTGSFRTTEPRGMEPVIVDPEHPKHFIFAHSRRPFYHLGLTAYHLLDPTNDDRQIEELLDYCVQRGFNKVRFLLTGYPRDTDQRPADDDSYKRGDPWKMTNYGSLPQEVNPLPAWLGRPHEYDFTRFNVRYWQKVDRAIRAMRERGIVATCIMTIEKQNLPNEYGTLTEHEQRLYRYAVARLAAFPNVWWDLGNEHNEYRQPDWAPKMGGLVKQWDPYDRLCSAHAYADWIYGDQPWADYIITQQYGDCAQVNQWVLKYREIPKPYVNEEYGYERTFDKPGHGMNTDWVRKCHWSITLAGGYATYGDWSPGAPFYTGHVGPGQAPAQLRYLRETFEALPFQLMQSRNDLVGKGTFCLARPGEVYLVYLPDGGETVLQVEPRAEAYTVTWIDPRTGKRTEQAAESGERITLRAPSADDWAALIERSPS